MTSPSRPKEKIVEDATHFSWTAITRVRGRTWRGPRSNNYGDEDADHRCLGGGRCECAVDALAVFARKRRICQGTLQNEQSTDDV